MMSPIELEEAEREANMFAMCLLMPESLIRKEVERLGGFDIVDGCKGLAKKFQVSETMMALRLGQIYKDISAIKRPKKKRIGGTHFRR